jgi:hypothetical protein
VQILFPEDHVAGLLPDESIVPLRGLGVSL